MSAIDDWIRLCDLLDDDPEIVPAVRAAIDEGNDPWSTLIGALDDAGALAYLDVRDTGAELADALPALPRIFRTGIDLDEVGDIDDLTAAITRANDILAPHVLRLVHLTDPDDEDAYPLLAVPAGNVSEISALTERLTRKAED